MGYPFTKGMRIRTRRQYQRMFDAPYKRIGKWIIIDLKPIECGHSCLGIVVTRRFGNAVQRNRFKRLVRESFRHSLSSFKSHYHIVVKSRSHALNATRGNIQEELIRLVADVDRDRAQAQA